MPVEQAGQRQRDPLEAELADGGLVAGEQGRELRPLGDARVGVHGRLQRVDEEVELDVRRALAPQRAVVVEAGDPLLDRHVGDRVEERDERVARRSGSPGGQQVGSAIGPTPSIGRCTQRKPTWLMPVSIICGRRAAGR